jgi:hypothetical protein
MSWLHAEVITKKLGFELVPVDGQQGGLVVDQNPRAHDKAAKGSIIEVKLKLPAPGIGLHILNPT